MSTKIGLPKGIKHAFIKGLVVIVMKEKVNTQEQVKKMVCGTVLLHPIRKQKMPRKKPGGMSAPANAVIPYRY